MKVTFIKRGSKRRAIYISSAIAGGIVLGAWLFFPNEHATQVPAPHQTAVDKKPMTLKELVAQYKHLKLIDAHNHDASGGAYTRMMDTWKWLAVDRIVLFGDVSEPSAITTDQAAWEAYKQNPGTFVPLLSGFDMHDESSLEVVKRNLEQGYFGLGEIAAASTHSPVLSKVKWKGKDPMDGYLPQIYEICAKYMAPILLHIDPPNGAPIDKLEEALTTHPDTIFIFAHGNAFNSPGNIDKLLGKHKNLYIDFFAGFTLLNPESDNKLEDFIPVMRKYPDRFMLSTDSGFGLSGGEEAAIEAMYRLIDAIGDPTLAKKVAHDNLDAIISGQPATATQLEAIRNKARATGQKYKLDNLSKVEAGRILWGDKK